MISKHEEMKKVNQSSDIQDNLNSSRFVVKKKIKPAKVDEN